MPLSCCRTLCGLDPGKMKLFSIFNICDNTKTKNANKNKTLHLNGIQFSELY